MPTILSFANNLLLAILLIALLGCSKKKEPVENVTPLRGMNNALRSGDLETAWKYSDAVLKEYADDSRKISKVAKLAHDMGKADVAANLLLKAAEAESFANPATIQQAVVAFVAVGRLFDAIEMQERAIKLQPMQHVTRRSLFDFYVGTENRKKTIEHGRLLIRHRQFDIELLKAFSNTERRVLENEPLVEMTKRNSDDLRPLIGEAKTKFDSQEFDQATKVLRSILEKHPTFLPAQALLGRTLVSAGQFSAMEAWSTSLDPRIESEWNYWMALGDWARAKEQSEEAARAYWEATRIDADSMESWSKLHTAMKQIQAVGSWSKEQLIQVQRRAVLLSKFNQDKTKFERTGSISQEIAIDIVSSLKDLGRYWEAEAWAAIATTLPMDDAVSVSDARSDVLAALKRNSAWQQSVGHTELEMDLSGLALPAIVANSVAGNASSGSVRLVDHGYGLRDESVHRGLRFAGHTSETLDQAGILLYQTLGCGGGTIDFDRDGWSDLYLVAAGGEPLKGDSGTNGMFRNQAGMFVDFSKRSNTADLGFGQGTAVGDVNEDGFPDLVVLNYGANTLLINNGDGTFRDASNKLPGAIDSWSASAAVADMDSDGLNDLIIVNYGGGTSPVTEKCVNKETGVIRSCSPMSIRAQSDLFLKTTAIGEFTDQTKGWNVKPNVLGRGLGIVVGSLDQKTGLDAFIVNDMTNNHYWSSVPGSGALEFADAAMLNGLGADDRALAQGSMGIATADLDRDGDIDFYVTNFDGEYNTLHENVGEGVWQDKTVNLNLGSETIPLVGFGTEAIDLDSDGELELVVTNGHVDMFSRGDERSVYAHPMQVFRRKDAKEYVSVGESVEGEYLKNPHVGRALWTIDADRDHMTDIVVTHQTEPVALLMNRSRVNGAWVEFDLVGRDCSRDAIGSAVTITVGENVWVQGKYSGGGYMCSNDTTIRFGLGDVQQSQCTVSVRWPDQSVQQFNVAINKSWLIVQADGEAYEQRKTSP